MYVNIKLTNPEWDKLVDLYSQVDWYSKKQPIIITLMTLLKFIIFPCFYLSRNLVFNQLDKHGLSLSISHVLGIFAITLNTMIWIQILPHTHFLKRNLDLHYARFSIYEVIPNSTKIREFT